MHKCLGSKPLCSLCLIQLVKGAPESLLRSLHIQKDATAYNYIKVGGQVKVLHLVLYSLQHYSGIQELLFAV